MRRGPPVCGVTARFHRPAVPPAQPAMVPRESRRSTEIRSERKSLLSAVCPSSRCGPLRAVDAAPGSDHPAALCRRGRVPRLPSALKPVLGGQKLLVLLLRRFQGDPLSKMARGSFAGIKSPAVTSFPFPGLKLSHEAPLFPDARGSSAAAPGARATAASPVRHRDGLGVRRSGEPFPVLAAFIQRELLGGRGPTPRPGPWRHLRFLGRLPRRRLAPSRRRSGPAAWHRTCWQTHESPETASTATTHDRPDRRAAPRELTAGRGRIVSGAGRAPRVTLWVTI